MREFAVRAYGSREAAWPENPMERSSILRWFFLVALTVALASVWPNGVTAQSTLDRFLGKIDLQRVFPGAASLGEPAGNPPAVPVQANNQTAGYVFLNSDFSGSTGYSGKPIHVLVGLDLKGKITGAQLVGHHEPIVLIGIPEKSITDVIDGKMVVDENIQQSLFARLSPREGADQSVGI